MLDPRAAEAAWHDLLPAGVHCSVGFEPSHEELSAGEESGWVGAGAQRRREFATGRWHARRALASLGVDAADLPRQCDGAPAWPPGVVGSISHTWQAGRVFAVAAVADAVRFRSLGVDVEAPGQIEPRLWPTIFLPAEVEALLRTAVPLRSLEASMRWSAKEAVFKAWGNRVGLDRIEVSRQPGEAEFAATSAAEPLNCTGKVTSIGGWIFALAFT